MMIVIVVYLANKFSLFFPPLWATTVSSLRHALAAVVPDLIFSYAVTFYFRDLEERVYV